jgi:hypothetical protein
MRRHFKRTALSAPTAQAVPAWSRAALVPRAHPPAPATPALAAAPPLGEAKGRNKLETVIQTQGITWRAARPRRTLSTRYSH